MTRRLLAAALLACAPQGCRGPDPHGDAGLVHDLFGRGVIISDSSSLESTTFDAMIERLARADAVFLGESHTDETTHRFERDVYEALIDRTDGRVVLALEMFSRDAQALLDRYLAGEVDEATFLAGSSPWRNYRTGYRPLIELARAHGLPVVASNVPAGLRRKVSSGGQEAFQALTPEERAWIAPELLPNSPAYWERFQRVVRGHMNVSEGPESLLYSGQSQWDNTMGWSCAEALAAHPGSMVLHVNGGFHSAYHDGTVAQLVARRPGTDVVTVAIEPEADLLAEHSVDAALGDFVVEADARARGPEGSFLAVRTARELRYALEVPSSAGDEAPVPLLIFLGDDGLRAEDSLAYWRLALEGEAAVAVVEPPYPQLEEDLTQGGRWFWNETYHEDLQALGPALEEIERYVTEHYPVTDDLIAGYGAGATVVARAAFHGLGTRAVAARPRGFHKLREWPLPDRAGLALTVLVAGEDERAWWEEELAAYDEIGLAHELLDARAPEESALRELERIVRLRLGLAQIPEAAAEPLETPGESRIGRLWAEVAARATERGMELPTVDELPALLASGAASGEAIPPAPGLFGGTTILVLPAGMDADRQAAWTALEGSDVMAVHGPFFRLRIAAADDGAGGAPSLADVLGEMKAAGRSTALVVPAVFCADAALMHELRARASDYLDGMEISFLPGLGGRLYLASTGDE